uniref:Uncharacterized protein n=1 Tax=Cannabis sativa TaxID=3483 RepID=A0A803PNH3_CANSA
MSIHSTHRVRSIVVLFVLFGLVFGTNASRAQDYGKTPSGAASFGSGINGATEYGRRSARSTTESVVGQGRSTRGNNGGETGGKGSGTRAEGGGDSTGGDDGGRGSIGRIGYATKDQYAINYRGTGGQ